MSSQENDRGNYLVYNNINITIPQEQADTFALCGKQCILYLIPINVITKLQKTLILLMIIKILLRSHYNQIIIIYHTMAY